jgi:hypothetical protein
MRLPPKYDIPSKQISFIAVMTALCISSNYLLIGITNIKFMDLFVFISGYIMGSYSGASVGILTWLIYGTFNPYGFNLPTLMATCIGESFYGAIGGWYAKLGSSEFDNSVQGPGRMLGRQGFWISNLKMGIVGFLLTFIYDLFTNLVTAMIVGNQVLPLIIFGIPFTITHEISNFFFFFFAANTLISTICKLGLRGGEQ